MLVSICRGPSTLDNDLGRSACWEAGLRSRAASVRPPVQTNRALSVLPKPTIAYIWPCDELVTHLGMDPPSNPDRGEAVKMTGQDSDLQIWDLGTTLSVFS